MSSDWPLLTFSDAPFSIIDGDRGTNYPKQHDFSATGHCLFLNAGNVTKDGFSFTDCAFISEEKDLSLRKGKLQRHDIVLTTRGTVGNVAYYSDGIKFESIRINSGMVIFRPDSSKILPYYLYLFLRSCSFAEQVKSLTSGSAQPQLPIRDMNRITIPVPSLEIQAEICFLLGAVDDRIALLRETNATLEAIAQALFKSWFVDFDPVHANAGTQAPSLPPEIQALFPATFTDSSQGPIPDGWEWRDLADVTEILNGFAFKSEDYVTKEDGIFVLRTTNFSDSGFAVKLEKDVHLPESFLESHKKYLCQPFDFHLVMVGASVGHTSLLLPHLLPAFRNQNMWCFRERTGFPSKFFIHEVVKANITDALRSTSGSAREFFRKGDFGARKVLVPNNPVLSIFEEHVALLKGRLAINSEKIEYLSEARDALLPRLISGQLRLPEPEQAIAAITD